MKKYFVANLYLLLLILIDRVLSLSLFQLNNSGRHSCSTTSQIRYFIFIKSTNTFFGQVSEAELNKRILTTNNSLLRSYRLGKL